MMILSSIYSSLWILLYCIVPVLASDDLQHRHIGSVGGVAAGHAHMHLRKDSTPVAASSSTTPTVTLTSASFAAISRSTSTTDCSANNGAILETNDTSRYQILCNVDFVGGEIIPFVKATTFEACLASCEGYNNHTQAGDQCLGIVFVPSRSSSIYADNCYLKSGLNSPVPAAVTLIAAVPAVSIANEVSRAAIQTEKATAAISSAIISQPTSGLRLTATASLDENSTSAPTRYASRSTVIVPSVGDATILGPSENEPSSQYVKESPAQPITLAHQLLVAGVNADLSNDYPIAPDTGCYWPRLTYILAPLSNVPRLGRDGGKGGSLQGQHLFIFCDTVSYSTDSSEEGEFLGMVSSSVAIDKGMRATSGMSLVLQDGIGQWSDDVGRLRGFAPMTTGEEAYNKKMAGGGDRYAVWPGSSIIPVNESTAALFASIIYDQVDMNTQAAVFTHVGNTLLTITTSDFGPVADRIVNQMFRQEEVAWGSLGGMRSWGRQGPGGSDGRIYMFGNVDNGVLVGRVDVEGLADRNRYEYWNGKSWSMEMPDNSSTAYLISGEVMDFDIFYSPRHLTFIMIYLNRYGDNTFYYRYLDSPEAILPAYAGGDPSSDVAEQIVQHPWSPEKVLYEAAKPPVGDYIYSGSYHAGYFGEDDLVAGGNKLLLSWSQHSRENGYDHMTVVVTLE